MPRLSDSISIHNKSLDRRYKLTDEQRVEIFENKQGLSQRKLATLYGVSRRLIAFILFPERYALSREKRKENGSGQKYYDKEKHRLSMAEHRQYKSGLYKKNLIKKEEL